MCPPTPNDPENNNLDEIDVSSLHSSHDAEEKSHNPPLDSASFLSRFWFAWTYPLLQLGSKRPLDQEDLPDIQSFDQSNVLRDHIQQLWKKEQEDAAKSRKGRSPSLARAVFWDYFRTTWSCRVLILINSWAKISQALILGVLLEQLESSEGAAASMIPLTAYLWAGMIVLCGMVAFPTKQHCFFWSYRKGSQIRSGLLAAIYAKTLRLPSIPGSIAPVAADKSKEQSEEDSSSSFATPGHVTNLASNDVERFLITSIYANLLIMGPIEAVVILLVGLRTIGPVFAVGYLLLFLLVPLQMYLSRRFVFFRSQIASLTDLRVRLVSQAVLGARVLKLHAWELEWERKIKEVRQMEVRQLQTSSRLKAWNDAIYYMSSLVVVVCVLAVHVAILGNALTPSVVFTTWTLYNLLQYTVTKHAPNAILGLSECYVACQRIQRFLELPEQPSRKEDTMPPNVLNDDIDTTPKVETALLTLSEATCFWNHSSSGEVAGTDEDDCSSTPCPSVPGKDQHNVALSNISLSLDAGRLYCVIGKVAAGKSALLQALSGELPVRHGKRIESVGASGELSIAYASQEPWIVDGTIAENIIMGLPFKRAWYTQIVEASGLKDDFAIFPQGDKTIVGDRGVQCSGGQKARISLARALYCDADVLLLDDPLSAVDVKVARSIFYSAILELGVKKQKCVVLVTHQHQFVNVHDDTVCILMENGGIICCGSYSDCVSKSGNSLSESLQTREEEQFTEDTRTAQVAPSEEKTQKCFVEARRTGVVEWRTWVAYGEALGGNAVTIVFILFFCLTQAAFLVTMTLVGRWAEQSAQDQQSSTWLGVIFGLTAGLVILAVVRAQVSFHLFLLASQRLHNQMLHSTLRATMEFYDTNPLGRILNRFAADVGISDETLPFTIYDFAVGFIMFLGSIVTALSVLLPILTVFPVLVWVFLRLKTLFVKTTRELKRLEGIGRSPLYSMISESLSGIATIRCNEKRSHFVRKFETEHNAFIESQFAFIACSRWFAMQLDLLSFLFLSAAVFSAVVVRHQQWFDFEPGVLGLVLTLLLQLAGANFPYMVRQSAEVTNQMVSVERILEYGNNIPQEAPLTTERDAQYAKWPETPSIHVENLTTRYRENLRPCLKDVSFSIKAGERIGVVGRTGSGKSSMLQSLFRILETETAGSIRIGDVDISSLGLHKLRTSMAVMTQSPVLFSGCSVRENLDLRCQHEGSSVTELEGALEQVQMLEAVRSLPNGLDTIVTEGASNFSIGQRQLLCLARALLSDCRILVLDEATANVDPKSDAVIQNALRLTFRDSTILSIAHRLDTVIEYDKILVLDNSCVAEFGSPADLLDTGGLFASMIDSTGTAMAEMLRKKARK